MRKNYYEDHPNQRGTDFGIGFSVSIVVLIVSGVLSVAYRTPPIISMIIAIGILLAGMYFLTIGNRRMLALGIFAPLIIILIVFGGCFIVFSPWR